MVVANFWVENRCENIYYNKLSLQDILLFLSLSLDVNVIFTFGFIEYKFSPRSSWYSYPCTFLLVHTALWDSFIFLRKYKIMSSLRAKLFELFTKYLFLNFLFLFLLPFFICCCWFQLTTRNNITTTTSKISELVLTQVLTPKKISREILMSNNIEFTYVIYIPWEVDGEKREENKNEIEISEVNIWNLLRMKLL